MTTTLKNTELASPTITKYLRELFELQVITSPIFPFRLTDQFSSIGGCFTKMPYNYEYLSKSEHLVYCYIASKITIPDYNFANDRIAKALNVSPKPVKLALQSLEKKGFLKRKRIMGSRRFSYALFCLTPEYRESLFEKSKNGKVVGIDLYFQIYLEEHDKYFKSSDRHIPLKDETIKLYCKLIQDGSVEEWTIGSYRESCKRFLTSAHSGDFHFPIFARSIVDSILVFDSYGNAELDS